MVDYQTGDPGSAIERLLNRLTASGRDRYRVRPVQTRAYVDLNPYCCGRYLLAVPCYAGAASCGS
jgi:hypothetical protein